MAKRTLKKGTALDRELILGKVARYDAVRAEAKKLDAEKKDLASFLKDAALEHGEEDGRSNVLKLGDYTISNQAKVADVIDGEVALQFLEDKDLLEDCTTRVLNKEAIEMCVQSGEISVDELETFMDEKVSYSINVKKTKK